VESSELTENEFVSHLKATGLDSFLKKKKETSYQELNPLQQANGNLRK